MQNIYIFRHFKVKDIKLDNLSSKEFNDWVRDYDTYDIEYVDINLPKIDKVYVSSQSRAIKSADFLKLKYEISSLLVEVDPHSFIETKLRLPKLFWLLIARILWFFNFTKHETKKDTRKRVNKFIFKIQDRKEKNILIISHGLYLRILINRLKELGYKSDIGFNIKNGEKKVKMLQ